MTKRISDVGAELLIRAVMKILAVSMADAVPIIRYPQ
jgi:hypothetical protein